MTFEFRWTHPRGYKGSGYRTDRAADNKVQWDSQFDQRLVEAYSNRAPASASAKD